MAKVTVYTLVELGYTKEQAEEIFDQGSEAVATAYKAVV